MDSLQVGTFNKQEVLALLKIPGSATEAMSHLSDYEVWLLCQWDEDIVTIGNLVDEVKQNLYEVYKALQDYLKTNECALYYGSARDFVNDYSKNRQAWRFSQITLNAGHVPNGAEEGYQRFVESSRYKCK